MILTGDDAQRDEKEREEQFRRDGNSAPSLFFWEAKSLSLNLANGASQAGPPIK